MVGVGVGFQEHAGDADRDRGAGQDGHEAAVAAGAVAHPARLLHRMGGVEDHRVAGFGHDRQGAHVVDQGVVAKADAALGQQHVGVAGVGHLGGDVLHVPGRQELALLDVDRTAGAGGGDQEVGLAAQEGRDLQHVHGLGQQRALAGFVHVGQHRQAGHFADLGKDRQ
jgi:hypothetical protein